MGSDVGQIFPTASLHRDHSISYALVCEKEISHPRGRNFNQGRGLQQMTISNFAAVSKIANKVRYFMRIVCWQTILMKYHTLFFSKIRKDVAKFVVCCSCDWHIKG